LLEEAGHSPFFKKAVGKQIGNILVQLGYQGNNEYLELKKQISEIQYRTKNIDELTKIVDSLENDESFVELKKDLKEFKEEFVKEIQKEREIKNIEQSKILNQLKDVKKN
jgi:hypothetical protein